MREDVSTQIESAIHELVADSNYAQYTDYIVQDYSALVEDTAQALPSQIAQLEKQLAQLKAKQSA